MLAMISEDEVSIVCDADIFAILHKEIEGLPAVKVRERYTVNDDTLVKELT